MSFARCSPVLALVLLAVVPSPATGAVFVCGDFAPGLVDWWPGDDDAHDAVRARDGTLTGDAGFSPGVSRAAFSFGGTGSVGVPDDPAWAFGNEDFSLEAWLRFDDVDRVAPHNLVANAIIGMDPGPGGTSKWIFHYAEGRFWFHVNGVSTAFVELAAWDAPIGEWHHVALVRDDGSFTVYVDGTALGTTWSAIAVPDAPATLTFGEAEGLGYLRGRMDEIGIWSIALTPGTIATLVTHPRTAKCVEPPGAPSGLTASPDEPGSVELAWQAPSPAGAVEGYRVYRESGGERTLVASTEDDQTQATDTWLPDVSWAPAGSYHYRVRAFNVHGESPSSEAASCAPAMALVLGTCE